MTLRRDDSRLLMRLWGKLRGRRKRQFSLLMGLMLVSAFAEVVSLGAVVPFLAILTVPERVLQHPMLADPIKEWGITSASDLILPLTLAFAAAALIAGAIRILFVWLSTRLAVASGADLSIEVYRRTLYQPYSVHVTRNSSQVIAGITNKVNAVVFGVMLPFLTLLSSVVLLIIITFVLIAIDPAVALFSTVFFGAAYGTITLLSRRRLRHNSQRIAREQTQVVKALQEGLGGIRDVLLDGTQPFYCDVYEKADYPLRSAQGENAFIGQSPRHAMEAFGMILIAVLAYGLARRTGGIGPALPVLGALALGAQRLLPAMQQSFTAWASIVGSQGSLAETMDLLEQPLPPASVRAAAPLAFHHSVQFEDVRFRYGADGPWVLHGLSLTIPKGARVGVIGRTGSGKSTTLDLLMGLLAPTEGRVLVDGQPLSNERLAAWQRTIAHVPQSIYLADSSFTENIAFGVPKGAIELGRVKQAARQAQIADYIESRPEGYNAFVGERGVRLSGGQRQRIAVARALYKQASVLVFDEATSALDTATEQSLMDAIGGLNRDLTIVLIAHRISTVSRSDMIVELEEGQIVGQGTYKEMLERSPTFRTRALR